MYLLSSVLRTQSIALDDIKPYAFPSMWEIADLSLPNGSLASIRIPSSLLEEKASGKVHGWIKINAIAVIYTVTIPQGECQC